MTTYVFPGLGSQIKGMGIGLFEAFPDYVKKTDEILGYSIQTLCLDDPNNYLNQIQFTQPAVYVVSALSYLKKVQETRQLPNYVAGLSLGEYTALFAADVFDFEDGLKLVKKRGELMQQTIAGDMAAVMGLSEEKIKEIVSRYKLDGIEIASYTAYIQFVIAGPKTVIEASQPIFEQEGATMFVPLKVGGASHCHYMSEAKAQFESFLKQFNFNFPKIPVIANTNAKPYLKYGIAENLATQMVMPVLWRQSIEYLFQQGETEFEEVGPGKILTGIIRSIKNSNLPEWNEDQDLLSLLSEIK